MTDTPDTRRFKVATGRVVTLPIDIKPGPGRTNLRYLAGDEFDLDVPRCNAQQRYLAGRLNAGDLVEITGAAGATATPTVLQNVTPSRSPGAGDLSMTTGGPIAAPGKE